MTFNFKKALIILASFLILLDFGTFRANSSLHVQTVSPFERAIDAWLNDDDEHAIPLLAKLARSGDEDAMLLLGQLAIQPGKLSPYLSSLPRKQRMKLLKADGGRFGVSWFKKVKKQKDFSSALMLSHRQEGKLERITKLIYYNEIGLTMKALYLTGVSDYFNTIDQTKLPEEAKYAIWMDAIYHLSWKREKLTPSERKEIDKSIKEAVKYINKQNIQGFLIAHVMKHIFRDASDLLIPAKIGEFIELGEMADFKKWPEAPIKDKTRVLRQCFNIARVKILTANMTKPLVRFCKKKCPSNPDSCVVRLYSAIGGYRSMMKMQSPIERFISRERYFHSKRYGADFLRRISDHSIMRIRENTGRVDTCVKRLLDEAG